MGQEEKEAAVDILGQVIEPGDVIMFASSAAQLDVGVVSVIRRNTKGQVIGYKIVYPYEMLIEGGETRYIIKKKIIRAGREVARVPASKLPAIASAQARRTHNFGNRLVYLSGRVREDAKKLAARVEEP